jgi:glycosyltransferase involved in cell wall biosynthesis
MSQRIKLLHLCASLTVGGAERLMLGLAERSDPRRFEAHVCSLSVVRGNALRPEFERLGLPLSVLGFRKFYDLRAVRAVAQYVRQHQIDIIHTHLITADVVGRVAGRLVGRPVVSTLQNEPQDFNRERLDRRWLEWITARYLTTRLVTVSPRVRDMFVREWRIPERRISTICNAVAMEPYLALPEGVTARDAGAGPVITTVGRLSPQKAQHLLLEAAVSVLRQRPEVRFMIVGQGRLEQPLKAQAQALGIADVVTFVGLRRDIPAVLAQTDIFVLSSLWEGLPLTAIEAMAAARPIVLTDVGGNRDLVESGTHGLIVPPGNVPALAEALLTLLNDPARRTAMGQAARARVRHDFSIDTITRQYEALYESVWSEQHGLSKAKGSAKRGETYVSGS